MKKIENTTGEMRVERCEENKKMERGGTMKEWNVIFSGRFGTEQHEDSFSFCFTKRKRGEKMRAERNPSDIKESFGEKKIKQKQTETEMKNNSILLCSETKKKKSI